MKELKDMVAKVGDYVEVIKVGGGGIEIGEQGFVVDDTYAPALGIIFPACPDGWDWMDTKLHFGWLATTKQLKVVYRGR